MKPFSQACENNKAPILAVLRDAFARSREVLEIGSGTGQHAVHFAAAMPHLFWRTSDLTGNHAGIRAWIDAAALPNVAAPIALDVRSPRWPVDGVDAAFSANTAHIMHWPEVVAMFDGLARVLAPGGPFALYGPFSFAGRHTSESNARFDLELRAHDPGMGLRDFDALDALARARDLSFESDHALPANNRLLIWRR